MTSMSARRSVSSPASPFRPLGEERRLPLAREGPLLAALHLLDASVDTGQIFGHRATQVGDRLTHLVAHLEGVRLAAVLPVMPS